MAVLLSKYLRYDWQNPRHPNNDRLIFSKGHACPLLYAMFKAAGAISDDELLSLRRFGSRLQGHPNPRVLPYVDVATGSLGQGLPIAVGMGLNGRYLDRLPYRMWVLLGDSEMAEGSVWEGFDKAQFYKLDNVTAILDMNRLGQRGPTDLGWNAGAYAARARAFGWHAVELDGHDLEAIDRAYNEALDQKDRPTLLVAKTVKGRGIAEIADKEGWHGKPLPEDKAKTAIAALGGERHVRIETRKPENTPSTPGPIGRPSSPKPYPIGDQEATRKAYGDALVALGAGRPDVVVLDAEVSNSTHSDEFKKAYPGRFFEMFISEQQLIGAAIGLAVLGKVVFASTFAAFFTRAYDQIRMAAVSGASIRLCGSHAGVSIGEDGPSQMGLEDLAMMRAVFDSTVFYPCDANQTVRLVELMAHQGGISYLRTTRGKTPVIYGPDEPFAVGGSKVVRQSENDRATVVAAGITLHEALKAYDVLKGDGVLVRVIDSYSVKPIDRDTLHRAAREAGNRFVVVEDHWPEGGLGDAVLDAFTGVGELQPTVIKLAVSEMPGSGSPDELLAAAGIDAAHIATAVRSLV
jgi:transketolase